MEIWREAEYAVRALGRERGFTLTVVLTLALASGATLGVFALLNMVLLRPLPYTEPSKVMLIWAVPPDAPRTWLSQPEVEDLARDSRSFAAIAAMTDVTLDLTAAGEPRELQAAAASATLFDLLGVHAAIGTLLLPRDDETGAAPAVVLSDRLWREQFGADASIVGRTITLGGRPHIVRGVLPASFVLLAPSSVFPEHVDAWIALKPSNLPQGRDVRYLHLVARLAPAATEASARAELTGLGARYAAAHPGDYRSAGWRFDVVSFQRDAVRQVRPILVALGAIVAIVLVTACVNVANLLLARADRRRREFVVRTALGATPARLMRLVLVDVLMLAAAGCGLGALLSAAVPLAIAWADPAALPRMDQAIVDSRLLTVGLWLPLAVAVLFGLIPVWRVLHAGDAASADRTAGLSAAASRITQTLAVAQVALATVALLATVLLMGTILRLRDVPTGVEARHALTFRVSLPPGYQTGTEIGQFFDDLTRRLARLPGVESAGAVTQLPMSGASLGSSFLRGDEPGSPPVDADLRGATPGYFASAGIPLLRGRLLTSADRAGRHPVAVVDAAFAHRLRPDGDVVGRRIRWIRDPADPLEIVGVVGDVRHRGPSEPVHETVYRPAAQYARSSMTVVLRSAGDPSRLARGAAAVVREIDPAQPIADVLPFEAVVSRSLARPRLGATAGAALGLLALAVAVLGVYGVLNYGVGRRAREFAVRIALGSTRAGVVGLVGREGAILVGSGVALGVCGLPIVRAALAAALSGAQTIDARAAVAVAFVLAGAAGTATLIPAWRASRSDPMSVLRSE